MTGRRPSARGQRWAARGARRYRLGAGTGGGNFCDTLLVRGIFALYEPMSARQWALGEQRVLWHSYPCLPMPQMNLVQSLQNVGVLKWIFHRVSAATANGCKRTFLKTCPVAPSCFTSCGLFLLPLTPNRAAGLLHRIGTPISTRRAQSQNAIHARHLYNPQRGSGGRWSLQRAGRRVPPFRGVTASPVFSRTLTEPHGLCSDLAGFW